MAEFGVPHTSACRMRDEAALMGRRVVHSPHRLSFVERERISRVRAVPRPATDIDRQEREVS
jgi:hypothetical protein